MISNCFPKVLDEPMGRDMLYNRILYLMGAVDYNPNIGLIRQSLMAEPHGRDARPRRMAETHGRSLVNKKPTSQNVSTCSHLI